MDRAPAGPTSAVSQFCSLGPLGGRARRRSFLWCSWMLEWATAVPGAADHSGRADAWLYVLLPRSSTVEVAATPPAVRPDGAGAPAASGSTPRPCQREGRARRWPRPHRWWSGRRRAAPRSAPAAPRSADPGLGGRAKSPLNQAIEHEFESGSGTLRSPPGAHSLWGRAGAAPRRHLGGQQGITNREASSRFAAMCWAGKLLDWAFTQQRPVIRGGGFAGCASRRVHRTLRRAQLTQAADHRWRVLGPRTAAPHGHHVPSGQRQPLTRQDWHAR
jgi:hypothetical protein